MRGTMIRRGEITAAISFVAILGFFLFLASVLGGCGGRCDSSACIDIDPIEPPAEEICLTPDDYLDLVRRVCEHCQDLVECEEGDDWTDECDADVPPGHLHKSCPDVRGQPLSALDCDRNCDANDPICIPCDLGDYA